MKSVSRCTWSDGYYTTYFGGNGSEHSGDLESDIFGNIIACGYTSSSIISPNCFSLNNIYFPICSFSGLDYIDSIYNNEEGFILMLNDSNQLVWSTYLGGDGNDYIYDIMPYYNSIFVVGESDGPSCTNGSPYPQIHDNVDYWQNCTNSSLIGSDGVISRFTGQQIVSVSEIENKIIENNILVYPNPNNGVFKISISENVNEKIQIEVYDILGSKISFHDKLYDGNSVNLDLSNYSSGIYVIKLNSRNHQYVGKIIKQ